MIKKKHAAGREYAFSKEVMVHKKARVETPAGIFSNNSFLLLRQRYSYNCCNIDVEYRIGKTIRLIGKIENVLKAKFR